VKKFNIKAGCIINKADLNVNVTAEIEEFLKNEGVDHILNIPYDEEFTATMTLGKTIVERDGSELQKMINGSWQKIKEIVK
jgi:MinD superfamily P-loop ATPase